MGLCISKQHKQLQELTYENTPEITYGFTDAKVLKVYDGDTVTIGAYYNGGFKRFNVRIFGIDCAEIKDKNETERENAQNAKKFVEQRILNKVVKIEVLNNTIVGGKKVSEKFGRLLANITTPDGHNLGELLLKAGLARLYYGGKKGITV